MMHTGGCCRQCPHILHLLEEKIYKRRRAMGLSQDALAEQAALTRNCIQQMECHEHLPRMNTLLELLPALEFSEEEYAAFWMDYQSAYQKDKALQRRLAENNDTI